MSKEKIPSTIEEFKKQLQAKASENVAKALGKIPEPAVGDLNLDKAAAVAEPAVFEAPADGGPAKSAVDLKPKPDAVPVAAKPAGPPDQASDFLESQEKLIAERAEANAQIGAETEEITRLAEKSNKATEFLSLKEIKERGKKNKENREAAEKEKKTLQETAENFSQEHLKNLEKEIETARADFVLIEKSMYESKKNVGLLDRLRNMFKSKDQKAAVNSELAQKQAELEEAKKHYVLTKSNHAKFLFQTEKEKLEKNANMTQDQRSEFLKHHIAEQIIGKNFFDEQEKLNKLRAELLSSKENKWYKDLLYKYSQSPKWVRIAVSTGIAGAAAFGLGTVGTATAGAYFVGARIARTAIGMGAAEITNKIGGRLIEKSKQKSETELRKEYILAIHKASTDDQLNAILEEQAEKYQDRKDFIKDRERKQSILRALAVAGVAGGTAYGLGYIESYLVQDGYLPAARGSVATKPKVSLPAEAKSGEEILGKPAAPMAPGAQITLKDFEYGRAQEMAMEPGTDKWAKIHDLATVKKGDGVERILARQLESNPQALGCPEEIIAKGKKAIHAWAGQQADVIAKQEGYIKVQPDGSTFEKRLIFDKKNPAEFLLTRDASGKFSVNEILAQGKTYDYARVPGVGVKPENLADADIRKPVAAESSSKPDWKIFDPSQPKFYEYQDALENEYISSQERLAEINKAVKTSAQTIQELQAGINDSALSLDQKTALGMRLDEYKGYQAKLQEALKTKSYEAPLQIKDLLPGPIMNVADYRSIISAQNIVDLKPSQRNFIDALFEKYTGRDFNAFKELPPSLQERYLDQTKRMAVQTFEKDKILSGEELINRPYKAYAWRSGAEIKWLQDIWDKFGRGTKASASFESVPTSFKPSIEHAVQGASSPELGKISVFDLKNISIDEKLNILTDSVKKGTLGAEEFGRYYAEKLGTQSLSPEMIAGLKNNFADLVGSDVQKRLVAERAMKTVLQRLE